MRLLLDTNVILDIALKRHPFFTQAALLLKTTRKQGHQLVVTATSITDIYYIMRKAKGREKALGFIESLLKFADVASVDKQVVIQALRSDLDDFEDAVQEAAAKHDAIAAIITRDKKDFARSDLEVHSPESFVREGSGDVPRE